MNKYPIITSTEATLSPATEALAETYDTTITSATSITLNAKTSIIEVSAIDSGVFLKYSAGVSTSAFDEYILADTVRHYVIPNGITIISVIGDGAVVVIEK